ncbi:HAD-IC family P-type ATPase [bacterium]|nr:HAD-IC family P-type ATPase [bacterium]MBT4335361.1 HAD-IC family P-type ATPase [bacterium]MBT4495289.1 HAD-IC family P-type ATPase [bacterium]MBT4763913.1 HAD-IC family P-type ATPase [bacterium]MBT5401284.1 HAD-IC family P-type ATPase [bacterium]
MKEILWHNLTSEEALNKLKGNVLGLTSEDAKRLKVRYGLNSLPSKHKLTKIEIVINQFKSVLAYVLIIAGFLSFMLGEIIDASVIFTAVLINVIVGFIQENKAQNALEKLRKLVNPEVKVLRDNTAQIILAKDLVPGDVILLEAGDKVSADARLLEVQDITTMEAALTGEPETITKSIDVLDKGKVLAERSNMVFQGTTITEGRGQALVVATGINTELGKIAKLVKDTKEEDTPLQKKLNVFSRHLSLTILGLSIVLFGFGILRGNSILIMFNTAVAVAVAAIPEGLVVAVTVILAIGMQKILRKRALVRKLVAAETLGSTTVICTDKTGTLTVGEMRVARIVTNSYDCNLSTDLPKLTKAGKSEIYNLVKIGVLCNDAVVQEEGQELRDYKVLGSGTEKALLLAGVQLGLKKNELEKKYLRIDEILFDSSKKYMATLNNEEAGKKNIYFKGAPELLLAAASHVQVNDRNEKLTQGMRRELEKKYENLSKSGLRVLGFGYREVRKDTTTIKLYEKALEKIVLVGFVGINDPLRPDVKAALEATKKAGLKTVIITGDNKLTAKAIAQELDINVDDESILEGSQLAKMDDQQLLEKVRSIKIYARVTPEDKLRIVNAWQASGEVVAMTGDGINDAPALKKADIGIALGSGTDVAKGAASLILLDNNFQVINNAIEQGRVIYDNIKKVILYLLSDSFSEIVIIFGSLFMGLPIPLVPAQILWINLVTDGFPDMALTIEPGEKEVMKEMPQERNKPILDAERKLLILVISIVTGVTSLALFYYYVKVVGDIELGRTVVFATLGIDSLLYVFSCRTLRHSIFHSHFFKNPYLLIAVGFGAILQVAAIYVPFLQKVLKTVSLGLYEWGIVLSVSFTVIIIIEIIKWIYIVRHKN